MNAFNSTSGAYQQCSYGRYASCDCHVGVAMPVEKNANKYGPSSKGEVLSEIVSALCPVWGIRARCAAGRMRGRKRGQWRIIFANAHHFHATGRLLGCATP